MTTYGRAINVGTGNGEVTEVFLDFLAEVGGVSKKDWGVQ